MPSIVVSALSPLTFRIGLLHLGGKKEARLSVKFKFWKSEARGDKLRTWFQTQGRQELQGPPAPLPQVGMPDLAVKIQDVQLTMKNSNYFF